MKHQATVSYPAPADAVLRMFCDPAFHERKLEMAGMRAFRILEHHRHGNIFDIRVERKVTVDFPGIKKSSSISTVIHHESWDTQRACGHVKVSLPGIPLAMDADTRIETDPDGMTCRVCFDWTVASTLPVVGRMLEKFIISRMDAEAAPEHEAGAKLVVAYKTATA